MLSELFRWSLEWAINFAAPEKSLDSPHFSQISISLRMYPAKFQYSQQCFNVLSNAIVGKILMIHFNFTIKKHA